MKVEVALCLLLLWGSVGCTGPMGSKGAEADYDACELAAGDTIYSSAEAFIQNVDVRGNRLLLQVVNERTAFVLLDRDNRGAELEISHGEGPDDVVSAKIMSTCVAAEDTCFNLYDNAVGKLIKIEVGGKARLYTVLNHNIVDVRSLCYNDTLMVGHRMMSPMQFFIAANAQIRHGEYFLTLSQDLKRKLGAKYEYLMSNCFAINPAQNRLLSFSYFFDCVAAYSLAGKLIKANRTERDVSRESERIVNEGAYLSYTLPYATSEACYVKVIKYEQESISAQYLHKLNWDGELMRVYRLPPTAQGGYAVTNDGALYCIVSDMKGGNEMYHVIRYRLE